MYSAGASIYQPLLEVIKETGIFCKVWNKGTYSDREEYSIFDREEGREFLDELNDRTTIDASKEEYGEIYVAGLAGDFCVFHTVKDLVDEGLQGIIVGIEDCNSFCDYYYIVYVPESKQVMYELANSADFVKTIKI